MVERDGVVHEAVNVIMRRTRCRDDLRASLFALAGRYVLVSGERINETQTFMASYGGCMSRCGVSRTMRKEGMAGEERSTGTRRQNGGRSCMGRVVVYVA